MSAESLDDKNTGKQQGASHERGRKKQKVRIKYRERIKIKERPKGSKLSRYWKKKKKNLIINTIILSLLAVTLFMVAKVVKQRVEMNKLEKDWKQTIPD